MLQPASTGTAVTHYDSTIENPRPLSEIEAFIPPDKMKQLRAMYPEGRAPIWGAVEGNRSRFERMEPGDLVLFYREGEFISKGHVTALLPDSEALANSLWDPHPKSGPYLHVFFLDRIESTRIPWPVVRNFLDYKPNAVLQRLTVLDEGQSDEFLHVVSEFDPTLLEVDVAERDPVQERSSQASEEALESGQGFASSAEVRQALEAHSMNLARDHFESLGFKTRDVSSNHPYDLRCEQGELTIHVEVKGTQTEGDRVILTANEVEFARQHSDRMVLFIVHSVEMSEGHDGTLKAAGGIENILMPWDVDEGVLAPISYRYEVPQQEGSN